MTKIQKYYTSDIKKNKLLELKNFISGYKGALEGLEKIVNSNRLDEKNKNEALMLIESGRKDINKISNAHSNFILVEKAINKVGKYINQMNKIMTKNNFYEMVGYKKENLVKN